MELKLERIARKPTYTIGHMYVDGKYFCDTIEDTDRGLDQKFPLSINKAKKKKNITCIPKGKYQVTLGIQSQKYKSRASYAFCKGFLPRLINVPAFEGILIHIGNTADDSAGCILVGKNKVVGQVVESTATFRKLYDVLKQAKDTIFITIV